MEAIVFYFSALVVVGGALGVILGRHPVHNALSLVATLFGVAILFINLEAYFLAAVQVIVYAGAIVVLFLFVIMLLGVDTTEDLRTEPVIGQRQLAALLGAALLAIAVIIGVATSADVTGVPSTAASRQPAAGGLAISHAVETLDGTTIRPEQNIRDIGRALFTTRYVFAFEITALLLTVAVVGAVMLARRPTGELQAVPEVDPPWNVRVASADAEAAADDPETEAAADEPEAETAGAEV